MKTLTVGSGDIPSTTTYTYSGLIKDNSGTLLFQSIGTFGHGGRFGTYCFIDPKRDMIGIFMIHREGGSDERNAFVEMAYSAAID